MTFTSETLPADHKAAIRQMKRALRAQIGDLQAVFDRLSDKIAARVAEINARMADNPLYGCEKRYDHRRTARSG